MEGSVAYRHVPTASGARRRARGLGGDARPQRGGPPRPDAEGAGQCAARPRPGVRGAGGRERLDRLHAGRRPGLRGRRPRGVGAHPAGRRLRRGDAGRDPRRRRRRWSWCSTSTTTTRRSSTWCSRRSPRRTARPSSSVRSGHRAPTTRGPWPRRAITAGFATVLRWGFGLRVSDTHGMKAMRRAAVEPIVRAVSQRHRPLRHRARAAGRPRRSGRRRGAGDGRGAPAVAHADRTARRRARWSGWCGSASSSGATAVALASMTAPRFAAALSEHPVASHAVGEVAGEILEALRRRRARPARVLRVAALRRHDGRPHVRARQPPRPAASCSARARCRSSAVPARSRTAPRCRCSRRRCPTRGSRPSRSASSARPTAPRSRAGPTSRANPRPCCSLADPFSFPVDGVPAPPERRPSRAAGDRRRGVGGARSRRQPARARRRASRRRGAVGVFLDGRRGAHRRVAGLSTGRAAYVVTRGEGNRIEELAGQPAHRARAGLRGARERGGPRR